MTCFVILAHSEAGLGWFGPAVSEDLKSMQIELT